MKKISFSRICMMLFITSLIVEIIISALSKEVVGTSITQADATTMIDAGTVETAVIVDGDFILKSTDGTVYNVAVSNDKALYERIALSGAEIINNDVIKTVNPVFNAIRTALIVFMIITIVGSLLTTIGLIRIRPVIQQGGEGQNGNIDDLIKQMRPDKDTSLRMKKTIPDITLDDVQGCKELKRDVEGIINYLQNPYKYELAGARMPKGMILYGPPGTGKTLIAKAIAGTAGVNFINLSGSDFVEMYVGVGAKRVRELFAEAKKNTPCIIFIDEIDAIAGKRGNGNNSERDNTINALLTEMDGFEGSKGIFVIAATNRLDMLDKAVLRPGRFDKHIAVPLPDKDDREAILKLHAKNKKFDETVDFKVIASQTTGFAGADLESLLNEAVLIAVNNGKQIVSQTEIDRAFFKVVMEGDVKDGQEKRGSKELELVAWHEAGHTLITKLLTNDEVSKVTILSSTSGAGGVTFHNPKEGEFYSKKDLKNRIAISYGGRAAEEILFGDHDHVTVGASSDIQHASQQIKDYIMKYGMSDKFGMIDIGVFEYQSMSNDMIVDEATKLANEVYDFTLTTLKENKDKLERIALALLDKETLLDEEVDKLIKGEDISVVENDEEYRQMTLAEFI